MRSDEVRQRAVQTRNGGAHVIGLGLPQPCRALDVGEEQRHRSCRKLAHAQIAPVQRRRLRSPVRLAHASQDGAATYRCDPEEASHEHPHQPRPRRAPFPVPADYNAARRRSPITVASPANPATEQSIAQSEASRDLIGGDVDEGYGKVVEAFRRNLTVARRSGPRLRSTGMAARSSICGAAFATGSLRRRGSKTPSSTCSRRRRALPRLPSRWPPLGGSSPMTRKWPTTGQSSRRPARRITVRQLLSHQAGLPAIRPS